jgi:alanyl aminopeptidase
MPTLSASAIPEVATALFDEFRWIRAHLATDATRPALDTYAASLYGPRAATLGLYRLPSDTDATTQLRVRVTDFLAFTAHDPVVRGALNDEGRLALGLGASGKVDLARVDPDTRGAALKVAVQESGAPAFDAVLGELAVNTQTGQRYELLQALGSSHDPTLSERARNYGTTPAVAVGELRYLYRSVITDPANVETFWEWFKTHDEALSRRLPDQYQSSVVTLAGANRCTPAQAEQLQAWFAPRIARILGGERILKQQLEAIHQCIALREHEGDASLTAWAAAHTAARAPTGAPAQRMRRR